jgi:hypothetical protein
MNNPLQIERPVSNMHLFDFALLCSDAQLEAIPQTHEILAHSKL